jgi:hypothetical protein
VDERTEIIELVDAIFDTVDAKAWDDTQELFDTKVSVDFTSLDGGQPVTMSAADLVNGWRQGLHAKKKSFHMVGHYRVAGDANAVTASVKGYAWNVLDEDLGGGMWEVWGSYDIPFRRTADGWRATGIAFYAWHTRGDDSVRTNRLA